MTDKEILWKWYNDLDSSDKYNLDTLYKLWCDKLYNNIYPINEDNLYSYITNCCNINIHSDYIEFRCKKGNYIYDNSWIFDDYPDLIKYLRECL